MKKTVLILGASGGIGSAIAQKLAPESTLILHGNRHRTELLQTVANLQKNGHDAHALFADLTDPEEIARFVADIRSRFSTVDTIVAAQGIAHYGLFQDTSDAEMETLFSVNVFAPIRILRAFLPDMIRAKRGDIVLLSSLWGITGASCETVYSATKGAVNALTKSLALELAPSGIRVNAVAPGAVETSMLDPLSAEDRRVLLEEIPQHRITSPEEIAETVAFLLSDRCPTLTGQIVSLNGGLYM